MQEAPSSRPQGLISHRNTHSTRARREWGRLSEAPSTLPTRSSLLHAGKTSVNGDGQHLPRSTHQLNLALAEGRWDIPRPDSEARRL